MILSYYRFHFGDFRFTIAFLLSFAYCFTYGQIVLPVSKFSKIDRNVVPVIPFNSQFGYDIDTLGDIDNNGVIDIIVGAPFASDPGINDGQMYVLLLNPNNTIKNYQIISKSQGNLNLPNLGYSGYYYIGGTICNIGDFDHDGINDLAIGIEQKNKVFILLMDATGTVKNTIDIGMNINSGYFGADICNLGDIDNDGVTDIAVGAYYSGLYIIRLNANGTFKNYSFISYSQAGFTMNDNFSAFVQQIGDIDGNGIKDLAVGAHMFNNNTGAVCIIKLDSNYNFLSKTIITNGSSNFTNSITSDFFGIGISAVGDIDNNGITDIMVGCPGDDDNGQNTEDYGAAYFLNLNGNGIKSYSKFCHSSPNFSSILSQQDHFGFANIPLGDIDKDNQLDYAISATGDQNSGAVYIVSTSPSLKLIRNITHIPCNSLLQGSVDIIVTAGTPPYSFNWSTGDTTSFVNHLAVGNYSVTITDFSKDSVIENFEVKMLACECQINFPNIITPNADGVNDILIPSINCTLDRFELQIYNRWGTCVFRTSDQNEFWNGKNSGKTVADGVYFYILNYLQLDFSTEWKNVRGTISIIQ